MIALLVWGVHRRAFEAGGLTFKSYWASAWNKMNYAWHRLNPGNYEWSEGLAAAVYA